MPSGIIEKAVKSFGGLSTRKVVTNFRHEGHFENARLYRFCCVWLLRQQPHGGMAQYFEGWMSSGKEVEKRVLYSQSI
jgi:hypothetical protein